MIVSNCFRRKEQKPQQEKSQDLTQSFMMKLHITQRMVKTLVSYYFVSQYFFFHSLTIAPPPPIYSYPTPWGVVSSLPCAL